MATARASRHEGLTAEDFETASIRSAAPSYTSEAPSYRSSAPPGEPTPPYSPPERPVATSTPTSSGGSGGGSTNGCSGQLRGSAYIGAGGGGGGGGGISRREAGVVPSLAEFRIPTIAANPQARHYHRVASRRAARPIEPSTSASSATAAAALSALRLALAEEEEHHHRRPLEDPRLVGEEEAARARAARLAREAREGDHANGSALARGGLRLDRLLAQMRDWDERERGWGKLKTEMEKHQRRKLAGGPGLLGRR